MEIAKNDDWVRTLKTDKYLYKTWHRVAIWISTPKAVGVGERHFFNPIKPLISQIY